MQITFWPFYKIILKFLDPGEPGERAEETQIAKCLVYINNI